MVRTADVSNVSARASVIGDSAEVHEVLSPIIPGNEAETLLLVVPLHMPVETFAFFDVLVLVHHSSFWSFPVSSK